MARKNQETAVKSDNLIADLISGTEFQFLKEGESVGSLTNKPRARTPVHALNCILGGGLPLGAIIEVFGSNASGKSSMIYETLGNFQKDYPNGVAFIIDTETSTDDSRLRQLGVDPARAPRMGASTLEAGFAQITKVLRKMVDNPAYKDFPVFILWDTLAAAPTSAQLEKGDMYGGGMAERARIIKSALMNIFPLIEKQNVLLVLLNQVMAEIGGWRPGLTSGGGNALKHDVHLRIEIEGGKTEYDGVYAMSKSSKVGISKSKISPIMGGFNVIIDITKGGVIDQAGSLVWWMTEITPALFHTGSWWSFQDWVHQKYGPFLRKIDGVNSEKFRQSALYEVARNNPSFVDLLQLIWTDLISERYALQKKVCEDLRNELETRLIQNLGVTYEELHPIEVPEESGEVSNEELVGLADALGVDLSTGEVTE